MEEQPQRGLAGSGLQADLALIGLAGDLGFEEALLVRDVGLEAPQELQRGLGIRDLGKHLHEFFRRRVGTVEPVFPSHRGSPGGRPPAAMREDNNSPAAAAVNRAGASPPIPRFGALPLRRRSDARRAG
ncbi:MAG: hypothetical protein ICV73_19060, partial [Acetobacteraceae bacterium]|nr:hypothetical protein [Acetobacteraceae bacterium]